MINMNRHLPQNKYDPSNHYWIVTDTGYLWSSKNAQYVAFDNPEYSSWLMEGRTPTNIATESDLRDVLLQAYPIGAPPLPATKENLKIALADRRWQAETGGFLWNGIPTATDRDSQSKIISERLAISINERIDTPLTAENAGWKFKDGVVRPVSNADFVDLSNKARDHVKNCFYLEGVGIYMIDNNILTTFDQINTMIDWPVSV